MTESLKIDVLAFRDVVVLATAPTSDTGLLSPDQIDHDLAEVLFGHRAHELITFFYRRTRNTDAATDLLAETFATAALRRRADPELSVYDQAWLHNIAKLELSRYFRKLRVDAPNVKRLAMVVPRLSAVEAEALDAEVRDAHNARLGRSA